MGVEALENLRVTEATCWDFVYFRQLLAKSRSLYDDNIGHRLNDINTNDAKQCRQLWHLLQGIRADRREKLEFCIRSLEGSHNDSPIHGKEGTGDFDWSKGPMTGEEEGGGFPAHLFPASFTLLYCPFDDCKREVPFKDPLQLLQHVDTEHGLIVREPSAVIPILDRYLKARATLTGSDGDDYELRNRLQQQRLQEILDQQEQERQDSHHRPRRCLFCPEQLSNLPTYFSHMFNTHGFNIGQLDNLVFVDEFLDTLQRKLWSHVCIFCEKTFPSMPILKKHIKNKNHYRIHPQNHLYDKFYVVNYLQVGKLYDEAVAKMEKEVDEEDGDAWEELTEMVDERTNCLFCQEISDDPEGCIEHMREGHSFDWNEIKISLDTYEAIRVINYLRVRLSEDNGCIYCESIFDGEEELWEHLKQHLPHHLPNRELWDKTRFLFPTFDDDPLLCLLDE